MHIYKILILTSALIYSATTVSAHVFGDGAYLQAQSYSSLPISQINFDPAVAAKQAENKISALGD
jgi:hypothetical protein